MAGAIDGLNLPLPENLAWGETAAMEFRDLGRMARREKRRPASEQQRNHNTRARLLDALGVIGGVTVQLNSNAVVLCRRSI